MDKFILTLLAAIGLAFVCGCDSSTSQVKNGVLRQHPDVTVGDAFDAGFDNAKWQTVTDKGRKIVRFTGKINQKSHDAAFMQLPNKEYVMREYINENRKAEVDAKLKPCTDKLAAFNAANEKEIDDLKNGMSKNISIEYQELTKQKQQAQADFKKAQSAVYRAAASADSAERSDAEIVKKAKMNFIYKKEDIAMNARSGQTSATKELQAVDDAKKAADDAKKLAAANIVEREKAINELKDKVVGKGKVVSDIIGKMDSLEAKDIELRNARLKELAKACEPLEKELKQASDKIEKEMFEDYKKNVLWPVGQAVQFDFIVYPDGKTFEIDSFANDSWSKSGWNLEAVLSVIFAR